MSGFALKESYFGNTDIPHMSRVGSNVTSNWQLGPSITMLQGDALKFDTTVNRLILCTAADKADFISAQSMTSDAGTTTGATPDMWCPRIVPAGKGLMLFSCNITLLLDGVAAASAGSTTTCILPLGAGSANDLQGGFVYAKKTGDIRRIIANTYGGGNVTITVLEPWSGSYAAPAADLFSVNAFGPGDKALKFGGSRVAAGVSSAIADRSGGNISCFALDVAGKIGVFTFNP